VQQAAHTPAVRQQQEHAVATNMGGGNGAKAATARARKAEKDAKAAKGAHCACMLPVPAFMHAAAAAASDTPAYAVRVTADTLPAATAACCCPARREPAEGQREGADAQVRRVPHAVYLHGALARVGRPACQLRDVLHADARLSPHGECEQCMLPPDSGQLSCVHHVAVAVLQSKEQQLKDHQENKHPKSTFAVRRRLLLRWVGSAHGSSRACVVLLLLLSNCEVQTAAALNALLCCLRVSCPAAMLP
jgi:hypothetical protein